MMAAPVLAAQSLVAGYGGRPVLSDVSIEVRAGEVLCVIGHNGAGKSTLMRSLFGLTRPVSGKILVDGKELAHHVPRVLAAHGVALMPEGRGIFPGLTVAEIFDLALWSGNIAAGERAARIDWVLNLLPPIKAFYGKRAGFLSGGQQQMVSIGRTLLSRPRCLMLDEPSIGLAPKLFQDLLQPIRTLQREVNMAVILVEQNVREALKISDRVVVMKAGQVILDTVPEELSDNARLMELY
jgi:branched-chain amino acid transport system ATP-binding protein